MNVSALPRSRSFCVYGHSANGKIFYIGSGGAMRPYIKGGRNSAWDEYVKSLDDGVYEIEIIAKYATLLDARRAEWDMIKKLAPSCNMRGIEIPPEDANPSFTVRLTAATTAEVQKIAEARQWSFSKTLAILIDKAIAAKVMK